LNGRGLVFHDHQRLSIVPEDHAIATTLELADLDGYLIANPSSRIVEVVNQEMHKMLAYPLFGSEFHPATTLCIPNLLLGIGRILSEADSIGR
jgi:hypothetical protein